MLDRYIVPIHQRILAAPARALHDIGIRADHITIVSFLVGLLAVPLLALGQYGLALAFILLNRLGDGLDGAVARISGPTTRGAYLDIALDFFFYAAIPFGFALADPQTNAMPAAFVLLSFVGTGSSFLAFSTLAEQRGMRSGTFPKKGLFYLGGLTEGTETVAFFVAICLFPMHFAIISYCFGALALLTTAMRWIAGWKQFGDVEPVASARSAFEIAG